MAGRTPQDTVTRATVTVAAVRTLVRTILVRLITQSQVAANGHPCDSDWVPTQGRSPTIVSPPWLLDRFIHLGDAARAWD